MNQKKKNHYKLTLNSKSINIELNVETKTQQNIECKSIEWSVKNNLNEEFLDCFNIEGSFLWYGGSEMQQQQYWPINNQTTDGFKPYLTGLYDGASSVMERYWISSSGVAIIVNKTVPLFVQKNQTNLCLLSSPLQWPYSGNFLYNFKYDLCSVNKTAAPDDYLNHLHLFVINNFFSKPTGVPDELMFKRPIWSTWAVYKQFINAEKVREFASLIIQNNFTNSQLEIDDKWQTFYGDFEFESFKFKNITEFIREMNQMGFRTTLWVHPFADLISKNFYVQSYELYAVSNKERSRPLFTSWWDSLLSVILDTTNQDSRNWFIENLKNLRQTSGIDSFKFDAGEVNWLPSDFQLLNADQSPNQYSESYARMNAHLGPMIEVRVGSHTQDLPIFVRMLDKDSKWGFNNGLKSVLTTALTFSILGYPYILPDMIGGNAYIYKQGEEAYPDPQLYIRWTQLTAFLPSMQFSIPPWHYDDKNLLKICQDMVNLHETLVFPVLMKSAKKTVETGEPIIKPLWWADNSDLNLYRIDDQFLVGDTILVAPIVTENSFQRDVYLPRGKWHDQDGKLYTGPILLSNISVPIEKIPYFIRAD